VALRGQRVGGRREPYPGEAGRADGGGVVANDAIPALSSAVLRVVHADMRMPVEALQDDVFAVAVVLAVFDRGPPVYRPRQDDDPGHLHLGLHVRVSPRMQGRKMFAVTGQPEAVHPSRTRGEPPPLGCGAGGCRWWEVCVAFQVMNEFAPGGRGSEGRLEP